MRRERNLVKLKANYRCNVEQFIIFDNALLPPLAVLGKMNGI